MQKCHRCGKVLATKQSLDYHLNKKVRCDQKFKCPTCCLVFDTKNKLDSHCKHCNADSVLSILGKIVICDSLEDMLVVNREGVVVSMRVHDQHVDQVDQVGQVGQKYIDTVRSRFKKHVKVFLNEPTEEKEMVQKLDGTFRFVRTVLKDGFTFVFEKDFRRANLFASF